MIVPVTLYTFREYFRKADRTNFSYQGLEVLFNHHESMEEDMDTQFELDVVALCCDYAEDSPRAIAENYSICLTEGGTVSDDDEEVKKTVLAYLNDRTMVAGVTEAGDIVYAQF